MLGRKLMPIVLEYVSKGHENMFATVTQMNRTASLQLRACRNDRNL